MKSASPGPTLRPLLANDLPAAHALSADVGWPHRLEDWWLAYEFGHGIVACDHEKRVVGSAMRWSFGAHLGTVGMVIVSPQHQGRGIGRSLMQSLLKEAGESTLLLNSTEAGQNLYEAVGFRVVGRVSQRQGIAAATLVVNQDASVRPVTEQDWPGIVALDAVAHGAERGAVLRALSRKGMSTILEHKGHMLGFALSRTVGHGHLVGPIIARDDAAAIALTQPHIIARAGKFVRIDTPSLVGDFARFLEGSGLIEAGSVVTMVRGPGISSGAEARVYGLINQALG
jgi:GNAT superfamily N-acetyltransferase